MRYSHPITYITRVVGEPIPLFIANRPLLCRHNFPKCQTVSFRIKKKRGQTSIQAFISRKRETYHNHTSDLHGDPAHSAQGPFQVHVPKTHSLLLIQTKAFPQKRFCWDCSNAFVTDARTDKKRSVFQNTELYSCITPRHANHTNMHIFCCHTFSPDIKTPAAHCLSFEMKANVAAQTMVLQITHLQSLTEVLLHS